MNIYFKETDYGTFCLLEKDLISSCINNYGYWEQHLYLFYSNFIKPDFVILDGGANLGFHTVQFGFLGSKVYSFEPQSYVYNQLCANILFNTLLILKFPIAKMTVGSASNFIPLLILFI